MHSVPSTGRMEVRALSTRSLQPWSRPAQQRQPFLSSREQPVACEVPEWAQEFSKTMPLAQVALHSRRGVSRARSASPRQLFPVQREAYSHRAGGSTDLLALQQAPQPHAHNGSVNPRDGMASNGIINSNAGGVLGAAGQCSDFRHVGITSFTQQVPVFGLNRARLDADFSNLIRRSGGTLSHSQSMTFSSKPATCSTMRTFGAPAALYAPPVAKEHDGPMQQQLEINTLVDSACEVASKEHTALPVAVPVVVEFQNQARDLTSELMKERRERDCLQANLNTSEFAGTSLRRNEELNRVRAALEDESARLAVARIMIHEMEQKLKNRPVLDGVFPSDPQLGAHGDNAAWLWPDISNKVEFITA
eukprot:NODE_10911_length_1321_cov_5.302345.p1 GENE.NODE_10911_length_1321_cov_5.302345~~NODE_10911_length_1321_cov_5.302345.p1  ORF type:complete len:363 (-),score=93.75 NODE_10911_length_1321_cov_5.302345:29-1117(-)